MFRIRVENSLSSVKKIKVGVAYVSSLSPQLFTAYLNDMTQHERDEKVFFADDTCFYASSYCNDSAIRQVQEQTDLTVMWFKERKA